MTVPEAAVGEALRRLCDGEIIIHPTESVYGFGGFLDDDPLGTLQRLKGRAAGGFVVLIPSVQPVDGLLGDLGHALAEAFWPGPLTLVLDDPTGLFHPSAKAADGSVAVRIPGCDVTLQLLEECGRCITSSSANAPGRPPARTAGEALAVARANALDLFALDAGPLAGGSTSTIVRPGADPPVLIREGRVDWLQLSRIIASTPLRGPRWSRGATASGG